jgi:hypothetical protein
MEPTAATANFVDVARRFHRDEATGEELSLAFERATLFCRRGDEVGFMALGDEDLGWIPVYSSDLALARAEGVCAWFSAPGADLLELVPDGYGIVVDYGSDTEVTVSAEAVHGPGRNGA